MVRYKLTFEYDGTDFYGWQNQPDVRTVEGVIEKALSGLYQQKIDVVGQGRTDSGVHAIAQVAHADMPDRFHPERIVYAMKGLLPPDVTLLTAEIVDSEFHARFSAVTRCYKYNIINRPSSIYWHFYWSISKDMNIKILDELAKQVKGEHDFINFCVPARDEYQTTICNIQVSHWVYDDNKFIYTITGNRFLRHMVRRIVGEMIKSATGKTDPSYFISLLQKNRTLRKAHSAPPHGLILDSVRYE